MQPHRSLKTTNSHPTVDITADTFLMHRNKNVSDAEPIRSKENVIKSICDLVGKDDGDGPRPLRVVIIGKRGVGKSSFINSIATAFSGTWHEYSSSGTSGEGFSYTVHALRFPKCCLEKDTRYRDVLLPTLIDVPGLREQTDYHIEELLRLLLDGHIKEESAVLQVYEDVKNMNKIEVWEKYSHVYENMKVDRLVFLVSVESDIPENLLRCAFRVCRPHKMENRRTVPIFGVLTKADKVDTTTTSFKDKKEKFMKWLGLNETRFLLCKNYSDDTDISIRRRQRGGDDEIDLPILEFMESLCDPNRKVIGEGGLQSGFSLTDLLRKWKPALYAFYTRQQVPLPHWLITPLIAVFLAFILVCVMYLLMGGGRPAILRTTCRKDSFTADDLKAICSVPDATYFTWGVEYVLLLIIAFLVYVCCEAL